MPQNINNNFNPELVSLTGSNLIEASAGTGKTYSIALLTLRLIIEKNVPIEKILMVTFTKAAVAELEIRVRSFVQLALKVTRNEIISDDTITRMVNGQILDQGVASVEGKLVAAQLLLDETSILTIHSFCQKTLSEFSFETGQIFGVETITPDEFNQITEDAFNEFWRPKITTIRLDLLERLLSKGLNHDDLLALVKHALSGKKLYGNTPLPTNFLSVSYQNDLIQWIADAKDSNKNARSIIINKLIDDKEIICAKLTASAHGKKSIFIELFQIDDWDDDINELVLSTIYEKRGTGYVKIIFASYFDDILALKEMDTMIDKRFEEEVNQIAIAAIDSVKSRILEQKSNRGIITFDDMILLLYKAVVEGQYNQTLIMALKQKYDAVFIDEFQDTDREQYAIFNKLFGQDKILFYIGDPKQSIYAFRKADIFTYFKAKNTVDNLHFMNTNHRSTEVYIDAMNEFFMPTPDFDTFYFNNDPVIPKAISYINVGSPNPNTKGQLLCNGNPIDPIHLSEHTNKKYLRAAVKAIITDLFTQGKYTISKDNKSREIIPSDIGILVKSNKDAIVMKAILSSLRIPSVTIDDSRLLASNEAKQIFYILEAVNEISRANINRALLSNLGGYSDIDLFSSDEEAILLQFRAYQESWNKNGVYTMLRQFMSDHNLNERLYDAKSESPERKISNIQQLIEILHKISVRKNYESTELIQWLKKGMEGDAREGDEYEQRLESDQEAVQIVTIHKSKGLEYNIVIAPHLDLLDDQSVYTTGSYRDPISGEYFIVKKNLMTPDQDILYKTQSEQENRRLLYVAITRARYQCFITINNAPYYSQSALKTFVKEFGVRTQPTAFVKLWVPPTSIPGFRYHNATSAAQPVYAIANPFSLKQVNWIKTSYSGLNPEHDVVPISKTSNPIASAYDKFVFQELKKGVHTGNLLHYIFEHIDFSDDRNWSRIVEQALKRLSGSANEAYKDNILLLLKQVTSAIMPVENAFTLSQVSKDKRLNELEFDFVLKPFNTASLEALSSDAYPFRIRSITELEGIMNGKMDLFFEHAGKYYILDWKSNFLGNGLEFYDEQHLKDAMYESNYNLQYLIYTVALTKYLTLRNSNFDYDKDFGEVIYLFLRGIRSAQNTGVHSCKPPKELVYRIKDLITV